MNKFYYIYFMPNWKIEGAIDTRGDKKNSTKKVMIETSSVKSRINLVRVIHFLRDMEIKGATGILSLRVLI